jgi:hypothetical protein
MLWQAYTPNSLTHIHASETAHKMKIKIEITIKRTPNFHQMLRFILRAGSVKSKTSTLGQEADQLTLLWHFSESKSKLEFAPILFYLKILIAWSGLILEQAPGGRSAIDNHGGQHPEPQISHTTTRNQRLQARLTKYRRWSGDR